MKPILTIIFFLVFFIAATAQSRTATVEYQKVKRQAIVTEVPFPEKTIKDAIDDKMEKMGYKGKESKGFIVYKGVRMPELGNDSYDLYFMADRKSRKEKENSTLTFMMTKGFDSFVSDSTDSRAMNNAKNYMDSIRNMIAAYDLEQEVIVQEETVKKTNKKYTDYIDDSVSLEKKKKSIEKDIEENKKNIANQQAEIEKQKQILETLRGRRRQ